MAYTLALPQGSKIHQTFHVSLLKAYKGDKQDTYYPLLERSLTNRPLLSPVAVLVGRIKLVQNKPQKHILVQWSHSPPEDATWENVEVFKQLYKTPDLEDKVDFEGGGDSSTEVLLDDNDIQGQIREWAELEAQDEKAQTRNQNQRAREEGRFTFETSKEAKERWEDSGGISNEPREARKQAMPS